MENVSSQLNGIVATRTLEIFVGEKSQPILSNWSVISDGSCSASTQQIGISKDLEPRSTFGIRGFNGVEIVIY